MTTVYVVFDGDKDKWAYGYLKGWSANKRIDFDFEDAHDLDSMTSRAQGEAYVKARLRERMKDSDVVLVLVGENTKNLYKFVRWELDLAIELGLPIITVNLNKTNGCDENRCPPIVRDDLAVHIPFKLDAIRHALRNWPLEQKNLVAQNVTGRRYYNCNWSEEE